jgi:hypothetical protein
MLSFDTISCLHDADGDKDHVHDTYLFDDSDECVKSVANSLAPLDSIKSVQLCEIPRVQVDGGAD